MLTYVLFRVNRPIQLAFFTALSHAVAQVFYREAVVRMWASSAAIVVNATMCVLGVIVFSLLGGRRPLGGDGPLLVRLGGPSRPVQRAFSRVDARLVRGDRDCFPGRGPHPPGGPRNAAAALAYWRARRLGDVVDVIPIARLSLLFVIVFSWIFIREKECITGRVFAGAGLALMGAIGILIAR